MPKQFSMHKKMKAMLAYEPLLLATILGVLLGILAGSLIRLGKPSSKAIDLLGKASLALSHLQSSTIYNLLCPKLAVTQSAS